MRKEGLCDSIYRVISMILHFTLGYIVQANLKTIKTVFEAGQCIRMIYTM